METLNEIWEGDLFDRRKEADDLIGYLESVAGRPSIREDGHAHVLAVDTSYGQGKTFFLRRLDRHLKATNHVSAFVDAWVDDLEDEPIVALAATLDEALAPWAEKSAPVAEGLKHFKAKASRVAKIVSVGIAKRGIGFLITQGAAEALGDEIAKASDQNKDIRTDALKDNSGRLVEDVSTALSEATLPSMDARIARFREGQTAIKEMKEGLAKVVEALSRAGMKLPITIIVDELDRCRPTYAIKVLEEIKHLFDVNGVAFVLGLHGQQLAHSVSAAYGSSFDGSAYLRRFFNRRYVLRQTPLTPLIQKLIIDLAIPVERLIKPAISPNKQKKGLDTPIADFISLVMNAYGLTARDAFCVMEMVQTSAALTHPSHVLITYLLPLIIAHITSSATPLPEIVNTPSWRFAVYVNRGFGDERPAQWHYSTLTDMLNELQQAANMDIEAFIERYNSGQPSIAINDIGNLRLNNMPSDSYANPANYQQLLETVARFQFDEAAL